MEDIGKIKTAHETFKNSRNILFKRWNDDFDLYRLKPYSAGKGYFSYTSNAPQVLINKLLAYLCESKLIIRIPMDELLGKDRETANNIERFLYGALNLNDERLLLLNQPILRDAMAWLFVARGGIALRTFVKKNEKNKTIPEIVPWDLYSTSYAIGANGLLWATHKRMATRESVIAEYPEFEGKLSATQDTIAVYDHWDEEKNGVIVESAWAKEPEEHGLERCPVDIILAGAMPSVLSDTNIDTEAYRGESVLAPNRPLYPLLNKTMSDLLTLVRRGVKVPLQYASADGKKTLDVDIYQVEKAAVISTERDDVLKPILQETMPKDAAALLQILAGELQRGGLPHSTFGELGFRLSGYALSQLQGAIVTTISPFVQAMERAYTLTANNLMEQFASGGFEPVEVMGRTSTGEVFGLPKRVKVKASDLKEDWRPEIKLVPILPKDDAQMMNLANLARQGEEPLLSDQTIRDDYLEIKDSDLEQKKIEEEWGTHIPIVRLQKTFQAYMERGQFHLAALVLEEMKKLMGQMEAQLPGQRPPTGGGQGAMRGIPPETLPMEEVTEVPPGAAGAKMPIEGEM